MRKFFVNVNCMTNYILIFLIYRTFKTWRNNKKNDGFPKATGKCSANLKESTWGLGIASAFTGEFSRGNLGDNSRTESLSSRNNSRNVAVGI